MKPQKIALVEFVDAGAALLIRAQLEHLGLDVALNRLGKPSDFFAGFGFHGLAADAAIISAHGDGAGYIFPEMAPGVDPLVLPQNRINADLISQRLSEVPALVISTACSTGTESLAGAFRSAGAAIYVAPVGDPDGRDVPVWLSAFFHALARHDSGPEAALDRANALVEPESRFRLFE